MLEIKNLSVSVKDKQILHGLNLNLPQGQVHAIMGPNGSGKSTLSAVLMGHPDYQVTGGQILFQGESLFELSVDERARRGIFLCFQYPVAIPGVTIPNFLKTVLKNTTGQDLSVREFRARLKTAMASLEMDDRYLARYVNDGFSGGEKKRLEILQMMLMEPALAILDETDSGLDIDALRIIAQGIEKMRSAQRSMLVITHYKRILNYIKPDVVHVLAGGRIAHTGGPELADRLENEGYDWVISRAG
ncbi:MAG: Fe-S cluster assembly ATPase SufC [Spirochaetales bacterium]|nr:Fe-S cluster assembly ATPase SufC [Spirochaetales bacterium]